MAYPFTIKATAILPPVSGIRGGAAALVLHPWWVVTVAVLPRY
jgi:hypothetical protein